WRPSLLSLLGRRAKSARLAQPDGATRRFPNVGAVLARLTVGRTGWHGPLPHRSGPSRLVAALNFGNRFVPLHVGPVPCNHFRCRHAGNRQFNGHLGRACLTLGGNVCLAPNSGHVANLLKESALCQQRTLASGSGMSAYYPIPDIFIVEIYVC